MSLPNAEGPGQARASHKTNTATNEAGRSHSTSGDGAGEGAEGYLRYTNPDDGGLLSPEHLEQLAASGILPEQAAARPYETIIDRRALVKIGLAKDAQKLVPGLLMPQLRDDGSVWGHTYRPDLPRWVKGKIAKYENPTGQRNGLDVPPGVGDLLGDPMVPLWVTEGSKKADCGAVHGLCVVSIRGVYGWLCTNDANGRTPLPEWRDCALPGRRVILAFDGDWARKPQVRRALHEFADWLKTKGAKPEYLYLPDTDEKTGLDDYLMGDNDVEDLWELVSPTPPGDDDGQRSRGSSVATQLIDLALGEYTLGITDTDKPFAVRKDRLHIAIPLRAGKLGMRGVLARRYFSDHHAAAPGQALTDALAALEGFAAEEAPQKVHLRVGELHGSVYIDMGDADGHVIEISSGSWRIVDAAPVVFGHTKLTRAMPSPVPVGAHEVAKLWEFVPVYEEDRPLIVAWLIAGLVQVEVPHPILDLRAEHGSAKTSIGARLVDLVDPSAVKLRQPPKDPDRWTTAAAASWVVALDNLSGWMRDWLADAMCRASTGDGDVRRALYTDDDVAITAFRRCVLFTGIDVVIARADLIDRLLSVDLPRIANYRPEEELNQAWAQAHPQILGALLTLAARVQAKLPAAKVEGRVRMADFAKVLKAVDEEMGTDGLRHYLKHLVRDAADSIDDSPFITELVMKRYSCQDTPSAEILAAVEKQAEDARPSLFGRWSKPRGWPNGSRQVTAELTRHANAMRLRGWQVDSDDGRNHQNRVQWTIIPPPQDRKGQDKDVSPDSRDSQARDTVKTTGQKGYSGARQSASQGGGASQPSGSSDEEITRPRSVSRTSLAEKSISDQAMRVCESRESEISASSSPPWATRQRVNPNGPDPHRTTRDFDPLRRKLVVGDTDSPANTGNKQQHSDPCNPRQHLPAKKQPGRRARRKAKRR